MKRDRLRKLHNCIIPKREMADKTKFYKILQWNHAAALLFCILHGVCRTAGIPSAIGDAETAAIYKTAVSQVHTAAVVVVGSVDDRIGFLENVSVGFYISGRPVFGLFGAGKHQYETDVGMFFSGRKNGTGSQCIETQSTAAAELCAALPDAIGNGAGKFSF